MGYTYKPATVVASERYLQWCGKLTIERQMIRESHIPETTTFFEGIYRLVGIVRLSIPLSRVSYLSQEAPLSRFSRPTGTPLTVGILEGWRVLSESSRSAVDDSAQRTHGGCYEHSMRMSFEARIQAIRLLWVYKEHVGRREGRRSLVGQHCILNTCVLSPARLLFQY